MKMAISTTSFAKFDNTSLDLLKNHFSIVQNVTGRVLTEAEAMVLFTDCVGIIAGTEPLSKKLMQSLPSLKVISRCGVGLNSVDIMAAKERNIKVCTTAAPTQAVAELTLGFALSLLRHIPVAHADITKNLWQKRGGHLLQGKKLGIIGLGNIGQRVAEIFSVLGCSIAYFDPNTKIISQHKAMSMQDLLAWADIITLHCPPTANTLIGKKELELMPKNSWLINTARGELIDEQALYKQLASGHLAGAALDVFETEPYTGPLSTLENVILSPHCASYAKESRIKMEMEATYNLLNALGIKCQLPA